MASAREMRLRIRSVRNISQVTRALEAVSAVKVRKAVQAVNATRPYATKAWDLLMRVIEQPGLHDLHPLLKARPEPKAALVIVITSDRGLAGAYNTNIVRTVLQHFDSYPLPVRYIAVGRKGRDLLVRRRRTLIADFSNLPAAPRFKDVSAIGRMAVNEYVQQQVDEVHLVYTKFINTGRQLATVKKLLPLEIGGGQRVVETERPAEAEVVYEYEPDQREILDVIIPKFTALQVYQAILESLSSEHAARMVAMHAATDNARELAGGFQLEYNKMRQQSITGDILDIVGGAEALAAQ